MAQLLALLALFTKTMSDGKISKLKNIPYAFLAQHDSEKFCEDAGGKEER